ncbi:MAG TPA: exosortase A [Burkholderiales bacterium]|nr:exosortase A [Burkholderiales bacterium]
MKIETATVLDAPAVVHAPLLRAQWRAVLLALGAGVTAIFVFYWRTAESMLAIWSRSDTFAHGYFIPPIALWLVWLKRGEVARLAPAPEPLGLALIGACALSWLAAAAGGAQVVQQLAMTAMISAAVLTLAGWRVARALAFPLAFLFFAVPMGEALIPPLMEWTATFTIAALQLTGIPVYREGLHFVIPSGNWSIVEGCSGLRYLIASVTVGTLYAYLTYRSPWRRVGFTICAIAVPIVANGLRAFGIVMIAHLSNMKLALGVDHFIYGWVFFGLVMLLLFWIGSFWREDRRASKPETLAAEAPAMSRGTLAACTLALIGFAAASPLYAAWLERGAGQATIPVLGVPRDAGGWTRSDEPLTDWRPHYTGERASRFDVYRKGGREVGVYVAYYRNQQHRAELVTTTNVMIVQKHPVWSNVGEAIREPRLPAGPPTLRETRLRSTTQRLLTWDWYWVSGTHLANPYVAKLYLARDRLLARGDDAAAIVLATPYDDRPEAAQATLADFTATMLPSIEAALAEVKRGKR